MPDTPPGRGRQLPTQFPSHLRDQRFWEELGRTIATFGFLEEVLAKAILLLRGTREYREDEIRAAYVAVSNEA
jgi:hypothetical protein